MNSKEYISLLLLSWAPVCTLLISILNHFLSSLIMPIAPGMIVLVIPSVYGRMPAAIRSEHMIMIQLPWWFHLIAVMASLSEAPFSLRQQLMLFTIVRLSSLVVVFVPGEIHTIRQVRSYALFRLEVLGFWRLVTYLM